MAAVTSAPRPHSHDKLPDMSERSILAMFSRWQTRAFWTEPPQRSMQERGTLAVLVPFNPQVPPIRIPLYAGNKNTFRIGSEPTNFGGTDFQLSGQAIDREHCVLSWDARDGSGSLIKLTDRSTCGIWVNDERLTFNKARYLDDEDIVTLVSKDTSANMPAGDHRYVIRYASTMPKVKEFTTQFQSVAPSA